MLKKRRSPDPETPPEDLALEIRALRRALERLNNHAWVRIENSTPKLLVRQFLKGLALGLGTVVGASVLVSLTIYFLSQINFIPIVGEWASEIADVIEAEVETRRAPAADTGTAPDGGGDADGAPAPGEPDQPPGQD